MRIQQTNYFSITTPQGMGGIGIIELFGRNALKIIGKVFRPVKHKDKIRPAKLYLGNIIDGNRVIDEVIIHFTPARNSLTRLDTVEINAHGGIMPCRLIGNLLKRLGARELSQKQVIALAHKQGRLDKIQAEALEYFLQAQTPLAAAVLLDQYNGALSKACLRRGRRGRQALKSGKNIRALKESTRFGIALTHPKRILILGRPNVGKSTLFNALLGQDRAITHHLPGTTRDTIENVFAIDGFPFVLVDTAGLRKSTTDAIEKVGMAYARKEIPKADVILLVVEKNEVGQLKNTIGTLTAKTAAPVVIVLNKMDTFIKMRDARCGVRDNIIPVSALEQTGLKTLRKEILKACGLDRFRHRPGAPVVFSKDISKRI